MKQRVFSQVFSAFVSMSFSMVLACTSTPKGTPASTKAGLAATDAVVIAADALTVASGRAPITTIPSDNAVAASTRIEIAVTGLMVCASLAPRDATYDILDGALHPLTTGTFSQKWESVTTALIKQNATYTVKLRSQRTGNTLWEKPLVFSGEAPWKIFVPLPCPEVPRNS